MKKAENPDFAWYRNDQLLEELSAVYSSNSWKMTRPFRWGKLKLRNIFFLKQYLNKNR
jgi:hypothetical protein